MTAPGTSRLDKRCGSAILSLARTVHTLRQHGDRPKLRAAALTQCGRELAALLTETDLTIHLHDGQALHDGHPVLSFAPTSVPFGLLAREGIGEIVLPEGLSALETEQLLEVLAGANAAGGDHDLASELLQAGPEGLHLRAPKGERVGPTASATTAEWWTFPEPRPDPASAPLLEREMAANLPHRVARMLFAELDEIDRPHPDATGQLGRLILAMLDDADAPSAAWVLERAGHHDGVSDRDRRALRELADRAFAGDWLADQLHHDERLPGLVALALELGESGVERLRTAAIASDEPHARRLTSLLPPPG